MRLSAGLLMLVLSVALACAQRQEAVVVNSGLEADADADGVPDGFRLRGAGEDTEFALDDKVSHGGARSLRIANHSAECDSGLVLSLEGLDLAAGSVWRLSCWIKASEVGEVAQGREPFLGIYMDAKIVEAEVREGENGLETATVRADAGTYEWTRLVVSHRFANNCVGGTLYIPLFRNLTGTLWVDDVQVVPLLAAAEAAAQDYAYAVPDQPASRNRHTSFLANFDAGDGADADYCRADPLTSGKRYDAGVSGRFDGGVALTELHSALTYSGYDNYDPQRGTAEFWACAPEGNDVWADGRYHWMLILYPDSPLPYDNRLAYPIFLHRDSGNVLNLDLLSSHVPLYSVIQWREISPALHVELPTHGLAADEWHHFRIGWEIGEISRIWLGIDGVGKTATGIVHTTDRRPVPGGQVFLGCILFPTFTGHQPFEGRLDDFVISSVPPDYQGQAVEGLDEAMLLAEEDAVRGWLSTCLELQEGGGWQGWYQWPSLRSPWIHHQIQDADDFSLAEICTLLLRAYELWGDERYLWACRQAGNFLAAAQSPAGCWAQYYAIAPDGPKPDRPSGNLEEQTQSFHIRFLAHLYRVTGDERYLEACKRGGEYVLARQGPEGWWPWGYNWQTQQIEGHGGPTLNDDAFGTSFEDMIVMYGVTGEAPYLDAINKAGEWLINAQVKTGPARGWADQYEAPYTPCWARQMEPPSVAMTGTRAAVRDLLKLYDLTGEVRYLRSIELCLDWMQSLPQELQGWLYYDLETGEPIMSYKGEVFSVFSEKFEEYAPQFSAHYGSGHAGWPVQGWLAELERRRGGPKFPSWQGVRDRAGFAQVVPTRERILPRAQEGTPAKALETLQQWNETRTGPIVREVPEYASMMVHLRTGNVAAANLLDCIEARRVALGDAPADIIPAYARWALGDFVHIEPHRDWYNTPLMPTEGLAGVGLRLRIERLPHFIEMTTAGEAPFKLRLTNWAGERLQGSVAAERAPGIEVTPAQHDFDLAPDAAAELEFAVRGAGAEPGYVDVEFRLTYGEVTETIPIRARLFQPGQGLQAAQYEGRDLLRLSPLFARHKLLAGQSLETSLSVSNITFEKAPVELTFDGLPKGVQASVKPEKLAMQPRETSSVLLTVQAAAAGDCEFFVVARVAGREQRAKVELEALDPASSQMLEAEAADTIAEPFAVAEGPDAFGGKYVHHPRPADFSPRPTPADRETGGFAEFKFAVPAAADFEVWLRVLWLDGGGNSFWISTDGGDEEMAGNDSGTGWHWIRAGTYRLQAGEHCIRVHDRETGARLDCILITPAK